MPRYMISHRHAVDECRAAYAAWKGFASPLRHSAAVASCAAGDHALWWTVDARDARDALARLPAYVADRSTAVEVTEVMIP